MNIQLSQKAREYLISQERYKKVCMARGQDRRISIFPKPYWDFQERKIGEMFSDKQEREEVLQLFMPAVEVDLESNGYSVLDIPVQLKKWAQIENDYIIIARRRRVEIWSKSNYESYAKDDQRIVLEEGTISNV
jgi:DNA-binding transcriptional regulator/RsmH inhibitor MraZ